jgi:RNA polymerase sigma-70 factor (ECF subfamily)
MELARESDEQLMQRVAAGQREPLSILLRRYANPLLTFIRRMNGDHHKSEDLFQEVFLAVWSSRRRYRFPKLFRSWLFGIAVNKCRAEFRSRDEYYFSADSPAFVATSPGPTEGAIAVETATLMEEAVMQLPPQQRSVVVLKLWNNFPYREIAKVLNRTESTVRSNMFHALESLRKYLEPRVRYQPSDFGKE